MADSKPANGKPIADVAHPAKPELSDASKPLITRRPVLKEQPTTPDTAVENLEGAKETERLAKTIPVRLQPLSESTPQPKAAAETAEATPPEDATAETPEAKPAEAAADTTATSPEATESKDQTTEAADDTTASAQAEPETDAKTEAEPEAETASDEADAGKLADPAGLEAAAAKQAEHDEAVQKLTDSKQYFLPINSVEQRKTKNFVIMGVILSVVLIGAWLDIAVDASLINLPFNVPHTHLFAGTTTTTPAPTSKVVTPATPPATSLFATYTSTKDGLSFQYPKTWALDSTSTLQGQEVIVNPPKATNDTYVALERSLPSSSSTAKLDFIHYVAFVSGTHHLFYRQVVYHDPTAKTPAYIPAASVTDTKGTEKIGDSAPSLAGFKTTTGLSYLETYSLTDKSGITYASATAARAYLQTANAKAAQRLLTSVKF